jgi:hypothetical protein
MSLQATELGNHRYDKRTIDSNFDHYRNCAGCNLIVGDLQMSDLIEIIYPQSMTAKLLQNGEVIAEYKVEQCDGCAKLLKLDPFGYKVGQAGEKLAWLCGDCR